MTTATETETTFVVTRCPNHGTKECADRASFVAYVEMALACHNLLILDASHNDGPLDCWVCCDQMVIDPFGYLDH